jgi:lysophospholipase L1-like esterase
MWLTVACGGDAGAAMGSATPPATEASESHNLQTTELVMGQLVDGIHPTAAANSRIADALIKMMEERKMRR